MYIICMYFFCFCFIFFCLLTMFAPKFIKIDL